jgi:hypothetical protein
LQANGNLNPLETSAGTFRVTTRSGQAADAPTALIISPVDQEVVDAPTVIVVGTADDPDGIFEVRVNGVLATSNDGFNTWEAEIELVTGTNTITVATADDLLNRNPQAAVIDIENLAILLRNPQAIVADQANDVLLVVDDDWKAVVAIDLLSDQLSFVSDQAAGTAFVTPRRIAVSPARNRAWVIDDGYEHLIEIDLATGVRSLLAGPGDLLREMRDLSIDETRNRLLVMRSKFSTNNDDTQIYAVDMATGARQVLSDNVTPSNADPFTFATAIVFDDAGDRLVVLQRNGNAAYAVDPVSGARSVFADDTVTVGHPVSAVIDAPQARVLLADRSARVIRSMNLLTGVAQPLWQVPDEPAQIALDQANGRLLVQLRYEDDIGAVDMATGQYSIAY